MKLIITEKQLNLLAEQNNNITLYHGTNAEFDKFDITKSGMISYSDWGEGIYFTTSKSTAHYYRVLAVKETDIEYNNAYNEYLKIEDKLKTLKKGSQEYSEMENILNQKLKYFQQIGKKLDQTKQGRIVVAKLNPNAKILEYNYESITDPYLSKYAKEKGYDAILIDKNKYTEEYVVINPNVITITDQIKDNINESIKTLY